jgi:hypothetical protein
MTRGDNPRRSLQGARLREERRGCVSGLRSKHHPAIPGHRARPPEAFPRHGVRNSPQLPPNVSFSCCLCRPDSGDGGGSPPWRPSAGSSSGPTRACRGAVALEASKQTPRCGGRCSDGKGKFGEARLEPAARLNIVSEFVVATAQVLNERVPLQTIWAERSRFKPRIGRVRAFNRP